MEILYQIMVAYLRKSINTNTVSKQVLVALFILRLLLPFLELSANILVDL